MSLVCWARNAQSPVGPIAPSDSLSVADRTRGINDALARQMRGQWTGRAGLRRSNDDTVIVLAAAAASACATSSFQVGKLKLKLVEQRATLARLSERPTA